MRRDFEWLSDILHAIEAIARHTDTGDDEFHRSELVQDGSSTTSK